MRAQSINLVGAEMAVRIETDGRVTVNMGEPFLVPADVPFRGDGASLTEVLAGRLDFAAIVVASGVPMARAGQTRLIAAFDEILTDLFG